MKKKEEEEWEEEEEEEDPRKHYETMLVIYYKAQFYVPFDHCKATLNNGILFLLLRK